MLRKCLIVLATVAIVINVAHSQSRTADSAQQVKAGEVVPIGDSLFVKVSKSNAAFQGVKLKGQPVVVVLEMDAGKKGATLVYKLNADANSSEVYLTSGAKRIAPRAVIEDFPSWGTDNDKEVDSLDPKENVGSTTLNFQQKGAVSILFDVPAEELKTPKKLSVVIRLVQPKEELRSFVVSL